LELPASSDLQCLDFEYSFISSCGASVIEARAEMAFLEYLGLGPLKKRDDASVIP